MLLISDPNGIRTRVTAVKGRCPRPLDDRVVQGEPNMAGSGRRAREKKTAPEPRPRLCPVPEISIFFHRNPLDRGELAVLPSGGRP